jgi:CPA1 family monovalent cation:H+ antiporter
MGLLIGKILGLFVVAILVAIAARRLRLPYTVGLVIAGITLALSHVDLGIPLTRDVIFDLLLPPLLFEAALNLNIRQLRRDAVPILTFSILGVIVSAAVVSLGMRQALGWPAAPALAFGVLIAATDPVAVIALFKDLGVSGRFRFLVESESLFNDGSAAVLFVLTLAWLADGKWSASSLTLLLTMSGGAVVTGFAVGLAALLVAGRTGDHLVETAVTLIASYGAFLLAESLNFSGVLATLASGIVIGSAGLRAHGQKLGLSRHGRAFATEFWEFLAFIANSAIFLLMGMAVSRIHFAAIGTLPLAAAIALVLLARAATVYPLAFLFRRSRWVIASRDQHILWWAGLRGALALALALSLPQTMPMRDAVIIATFAVTIFSVVVQGLTMPALLRLLGVGREDAAGPPSSSQAVEKAPQPRSAP